MNIIEIKNEDGVFQFYENDAIGQHLQKGNRWEKHFTELCSLLIKKGDRCIDVGAHTGLSTIPMYNAGAEIVHSFEPNYETYQLLTANCEFNLLPTKYCYNMAVGNEYKMVGMEKYNSNSGLLNYGSYSITDGSDIQMIRLDDFDLSNTSLIKIDAQGSEYQVLKGAEQLILRNFPNIFIEIEEPQLKKFNTNGEAVIEHLHLLGYRVFRIETNPLTDYIAIHDLNVEAIKLLKYFSYEVSLA